MQWYLSERINNEMLKSHEYDSILSKQSLNVGVVKKMPKCLK